MSCCPGGYCKFKFPEGPPLTDNSVSSLKASYLFLPYGTLLEKGEIIRIWTEGGKFKVVIIQDKVEVEVLPAGPESLGDKTYLPWQLIALDSGMEYEELMDWYHHPLNNSSSKPVVLIFSQLKSELTWKEKLHNLLYKIRNL